MNDNEKEFNKFTIEIPGGTILKMDGQPVILKDSLFIEQVNNTIFDISKHDVMETDLDPEACNDTSVAAGHKTLARRMVAKHR